MPAVEVKIWLAIKSRVDTIPLPFAKAWPSEPFTPQYEDGELTPYLRIARVTVDPVPMMIEDGAKHMRTGTLMVTLVHPLMQSVPGREGANVSVYDEYAGQIAAHFADGIAMRYDNVCVKTVSQPHVQPGYLDEGYWTVPVSIPWRTFA